MYNVADIIKKLMERNNVNSRELGDRIGISRQMVEKTLKVNNFTINNLDRYAAALGYDLLIEFIPKNDQENKTEV